MNLFKILTVLETEACGPLEPDPTHMDADLLENGDQPYPWQGMCIGVGIVVFMIFAMLLPWVLGWVDMIKWLFN